MEGPLALVTGASRGIGAAIAAELARRGAAVVCAARGREALAATVAELGASGHRVRALPLDVADPAALPAALAALADFETELGPVEWLVNNAGIALSAPLARGTDEQGRDLYERHLAVNFHGPRRLLEALLPGFLARRRGRVLNVASSAGLVGYAYVSAYCASKHALIGYTRAAALELEAKGLAVGALCPHYVDSPMLAASVRNVVQKTGQSEAQARAFFAAQNPSGALVTPQEVALAAAEWLATGGNGELIELRGRGERRILR
jgi:3-hydroxybutyrate dehydrogenase